MTRSFLLSKKGPHYRRAVIRKSKIDWSIGTSFQNTPRNMWYADLWCCSQRLVSKQEEVPRGNWTGTLVPQRIQYWSFGAVLGATLEHFRREHRS